MTLLTSRPIRPFTTTPRDGASRNDRRLPSSSRLLPIAAALVLLSGCTHTVRLHDPQAPALPPTAATPCTGCPIAFVDAIDVQSGMGASTPALPSSGFKEKFVRKLSDANVFEHVVTSYPLGQAGVVTIRITAKEDLDTHDAANGTKAFFTGFTMFLLTPVLPYSYDYRIAVNVEAICDNADRRTFAVTESGDSSAIGIGQINKAVGELSASVIDRAAAKIVSEIGKDSRFLAECAARSGTAKQQ